MLNTPLIVLVLGWARLVASQAPCTANAFCFSGSPDSPGPQVPCDPSLTPLPGSNTASGCVCISEPSNFYCYVCEAPQPGASFNQICNGGGGMASSTSTSTTTSSSSSTTSMSTSVTTPTSSSTSSMSTSLTTSSTSMTASSATITECTLNPFCFSGSVDSPGPQIPCDPSITPLPGGNTASGCVCIGPGPGTVPDFYCYVCEAPQPSASFNQICGGGGTSSMSSSSSSTSSTPTCTSTSIPCPTSTTAPANFNWEPLVQRACQNFDAASTASPALDGFYGQVRNIVCAASKSMDSCCSPMFPEYGVCPGEWAGQFVEFTFSSFLGPCNPPFNSMTGQEIQFAANLLHSLLPWLLTEANPGIGIPVAFLSNYINSNDIASAIAGILHLPELFAGFSGYISCAEMLADCNLATLTSLFNSIDAQHNQFFNCAILPGLIVEGNNGELSPLPVLIAQTLVPFIAGTLRQLIEANVYNKFIQDCSSARRRAVSPETNVTALAAALGLTTPNDAPLKFDPRAWIPTTSTPPQSNPFVDLQILPSSQNVDINVAISNSTNGASVQISGDRSSFQTEAVIAVSINSASEGSLFSSGNLTLPSTTGEAITVFGVIVILTPSTFPIDDGSSLFQQSSLLNSTFANTLNQSSFYDTNDYNILFNTFDLSITYDLSQAPSGVEPSIVDLVSGTKLQSSSSSNTVSASGVTGQSGAWGGGGVYCLGY